jgi:glycosyltransferase involved in cell wall biosynthesis
MVKVLFITGKLQHYRIPILNIIGSNSNISLTVAHASIRLKTENDCFDEVILCEKRIGPFTYHTSNFMKFCKDFDIVVSMFYLQKLSLMSLLFYKKHFKLVYWGIGVRASQTNKFDSPSVLNNFRYFVARKSDAMIFYSDYVKSKYIDAGVAESKLFVMPNTVAVIDTNEDEIIIKDFISFIGALNKSKNIFALLEAYLKVYAKTNDLPNLEIIGNGEDYNDVKDWISKHQLQSKVTLHGSIYDPIIKSNILKRSLVNISPSQAGLSVLECFGYGVPFATSKNAYTGGERLNIKHNENGFLFSDENLEDEIAKVIELSSNKREVLVEMGKNAKRFYEEFRTPELMASGFIDAINHVLKK